MFINANTKIASILKHNADALDAIISISTRFEKLRNPVLRKLLAGRASIAMASKIGGCSISDFFEKLKPLGFEIDAHTPPVPEEGPKTLPAFLHNVPSNQITTLDIRPILDSGKDPLALIVQKTKELQPGQVLKIINTFEPTPLMLLLGKQGFESFADILSIDYVETYFYKTTVMAAESPLAEESNESWESIAARYQSKMHTIDVRAMEMPLPMMTILEALDNLPQDMALYVYHKRIPVYLLPELADRKFSYRVKEIREGEVHLIIFK